MLEDYIGWLINGDAYDYERTKRPIATNLLMTFGGLAIGFLAGFILRGVL